MYPYFQTFPNFYFRFIDDLFLIWNGNEMQLLDFITILNSRYPAINFQLEYSKSIINFLDTKIYKNSENDELLTTIY